MRKKITIDEMHNLAKNRGGKCLSKQHINARTKLLWECAEKHEWEAIPSSIKKGTWCPKCAAKKRNDKMKLTINEMHQIAKARGGKCLSKSYVNTDTKHLWECSKKHQWEAAPNIIKRGHWCPKCGAKKSREKMKLTIAEMRQLAKERGGKCLSKKYVDSNTKLSWECAEKHQWKARPSHIKVGHWCSKCAGVEKLTIEEMRQIAKARGGKCLSNNYVNTYTKLLWECAEKHQWETVPGHVREGHWCRKCSGFAKLTIAEMHQLAKARGGKCLSKKYVDSNTKLLWECAEKHQWEAQPRSIKAGSWCRICSSMAQSKKSFQSDRDYKKLIHS